MDEGGNGEETQSAPFDDVGFARLRRIPLFQGLPLASLRSMLADAQVRRIEDGAVLFLQGDDADRFYVLLDGWVKLYRLTEDGTQALVTVVAPGETFAEAAVFASARFPVCAETAGAATVLALPRRGFAAALAADPQIALAMLASLSMRLRHLVERIEQLQVKSAPQRLAAFLVHLCPRTEGSAMVGLPFAKGLVAQRLGMRPETFSRAVAALRSQGVRMEGGQVSISDVGCLRSYSEATRS